MKSLIISLLLTLAYQASALPIAHQIYKTNPQKVVTTPGSSPELVNLAAAFEFSNACHAGVSEVLSELRTQENDIITLNYVSTFIKIDIDAVCTADFNPVLKWNIIGQDLELGSHAVVNGKSVTILQAPEAAICIKSLCEDGKARDSYTCACSNGLSH